MAPPTDCYEELERCTRAFMRSEACTSTYGDDAVPQPRGIIISITVHALLQLRPFHAKIMLNVTMTLTSMYSCCCSLDEASHDVIQLFPFQLRAFNTSTLPCNNPSWTKMQTASLEQCCRLRHAVSDSTSQGSLRSRSRQAQEKPGGAGGIRDDPPVQRRYRQRQRNGSDPTPGPKFRVYLHIRRSTFRLGRKP